MIEPLEIVETAAHPAAVVHLRIPAQDCREEFPRAVQELLAVLGEQGVSPSGPLFDRHFEMPGATFDFELGFPIDQPVTPAGRVESGELPAAKVIRTVYQGPYEGLANAWAQFDERSKPLLEEAALRREKGLWQVYRVGPGQSSDSSSWRTELNVPVGDR